MKKLLLILLLWAGVSYSQFHYTATINGDTLSLITLINTDKGTSLTTLTSLFTYYELAVYPVDSNAVVFFNSAKTQKTTLYAGKFNYLGVFFANAFPNLWFAASTATTLDIGIDLWEKR